MSDEKGRGLGMPIEMARQSLRDDPHTAEIAESLGVDVEDYIDKVMHYALHPDAEPQLELLDDESAAGLGPDAPSLNDVTQWFDRLASGEETLNTRPDMSPKDGFTTEASPSDALRAQTGQAIPRQAPQVSDLDRPKSPSGEGPGSVLRQQMLAQQRNFQLGMDARRAGRGGNKTPSK